MLNVNHYSWERLNLSELFGFILELLNLVSELLDVGFCLFSLGEGGGGLLFCVNYLLLRFVLDLD